MLFRPNNVSPFGALFGCIRWGLGFLVLAASLLAHGANTTLRVLAWPGYADADVVKTFEQRMGVKVEVTVIDSDEALWQRINKNKAGDFDVFAVNTAELQRYIKDGLVVPINTGSIPNLSRQLPRFQNRKAIAGVVHGDKTFAIPYTYSEMGLIYDRQQVKKAPTSIRALWDPQYRGKVILYDAGTHNFSLVTQVQGSSTAFKIKPGDWNGAVNELIALRRNALAFYTQPEASVDMFKRHHAALLFANYGSQQVKLLREAGVDVGYTVPKEGAFAWLDCWVITRGNKNGATAEAWINFMLEQAPGEALLARQGLANTTSESPHLNPADRLIWLEPVEDADKRNRLWRRIVSGDRAARVLAP